MRLTFSKIQSSGSDHVVLEPSDDFALSDGLLRDVARLVCSRSGLIGADGLVVIGGATDGFTSARIFTPDSQEPALCVNGILCAARYLNDRGRLENGVIQQGVRRRVRHLNLGRFPSGGFCLEGIEVSPPLESERSSEKAAWMARHVPAPTHVEVQFLSTGTPHAIAFVEKIDESALQSLGELANVERQIFPLGMNISLCRALSKSEIFVRTYERGGAGRSLSCASATVAAVHAGVSVGQLDQEASELTAYTLGGVAIVARVPRGSTSSYSYSADASRAFDASALVSEGVMGPLVQGVAYFQDIQAYGKFREQELESIRASHFVFGTDYV